VLDADDYLYITDYNNNRIVPSGPNGVQCLVGCVNSNGSGSNELNCPHSLSFDSYGNLFVADLGNSRSQKFLLLNNFCGEYYRKRIIEFLLYINRMTLFSNVYFIVINLSKKPLFSVQSSFVF
jgi:hypothetical protein